MSTYGYFKHDEMSGYAIAHHGIKGQKWGIRRFQNPDGSLTAAGRRRYNINWAEKKPGWYYQTGQSIQDQHKMYRDIEKSFKKENKGISNDDLESKIKNEYKRIYKENSDIQYNLGKSSHDFLKGTQHYGLLLGAAGGGVAGAIDAIAQSKIKDSPVDRHDRYREEILKKLAPEKSREFKENEKRNKILNKEAKKSNKIANDITDRTLKGEKITKTESPYKVKGASQSIKNFSVSKAASDCGKMIDKFNKELGNTSGPKTYSGEDIQMFLEKNLKEFNDLWDDGSNTIFDLEEKIAKELDRKGYRFID